MTNAEKHQAQDAFIERAEEVFCAAMELSQPDKRHFFLDRACAGDARLRAEVEKMLADQKDVERLFRAGGLALLKPEDHGQVSSNEVKSSGDAGQKPIVEEKIGTWIGRYKLLQIIGEGGCGVVYMAEQEKPVRRRVALKIIKLGMDTKNVIARFEAERQALAMMDHPNIARVLDAGSTKTGRPYFVMELVRGFKITEYCDQNHLDTRQRLNLFVQVCLAIQHAHQKGIIHRDIKPSNILVTLHDGLPVPKVIDFGIAKAMEERLTDKTLFTSYAQIIGTPAYMSPEQAEMSGLDVDTRSDIYSLGVLLYELLTGKTPFEQKDLLKFGLDEMRRTLRETEPYRPSAKVETLHGPELEVTADRRGVEPPRLRSLLRGDLDWIVMKALEKDRKRRYETANGLVMDVQRHLNNEPVMARPPSRLYRFQKLVRRNKVIFFAGTIVVLALAIGFGVSAWMFLREKQARHEAEQARTNETQLRRQAEIREKITRATVLISHGEMASADDLIAEIPVAACPPYMEEVRVFRELTDWNAVNGRWEQAANRASAVVQLDRVDITDKSGAVTCDYMSAAAALLQVKDLNGYARLCRDARSRFATTTDPVSAEQVLKVNLLRPAGDEALTALRPLVAIALKSFSDRLPVNPTTVEAWRLMALALYEYRVGHLEKAVGYAQITLRSQDAPARTVMMNCILAMSYDRLGRPKESMAAFEAGADLIDVRFKKPLSSTPLDTWYSWIMARVLHEEAAGQIGRPPSGSKTASE